MPDKFCNGIQFWRLIVRYGHHEQWNVAGYPDSLKGHTFSVLARIPGHR